MLCSFHFLEHFAFLALILLCRRLLLFSKNQYTAQIIFSARLMIYNSVKVVNYSLNAPGYILQNLR